MFRSWFSVKILPTKVVFEIRKQTKTTRPGKRAKRVILQAFTKKNSEMLHRTSYAATRCGSHQYSNLVNSSMWFTSILKLREQLTSTTIARWIKIIIVKSGIISCGAQSTRSRTFSERYHECGWWLNASTFNGFTRKLLYHLMSSLGKQFFKPRIREELHFLLSVLALKSAYLAMNVR